MLKTVGAAILCVALISTGAQARGYSHHGYSHSYRSRERDLVTHGHYTNVSGHRVHSPSRTYSGARPVGASAHCADGSWSFSEHARGTCSHHGGVR